MVLKVDHGITRREYLMFKSLGMGFTSFEAREAISSTAIEHPEWDMDEIRLLADWEPKMTTPIQHKEKRNKNRGLSRKMEAYFLSNVNRSITISELKREFIGIDADALRGAIAYIRTRANRTDKTGRGHIQPNCPIEVEIQGSRWRLPSTQPNRAVMSAPESSAQLFEALAVTKTGVVLVEGEDGEIYKLTKI